MAATPSSELQRPSWLSYFLALLLVTAAFAYGNRDLLSGDAFPRWDASGFYAPSHMLVADHAREGEFLLWNPWMNGGRPDSADAQVGSFSPLKVGLGWLTGGKLQGYIIYWLVIWWLGAVGMLALARHLRAPAWGAVIAAAAFYSCGFFLGHGQHMSFVYSNAFLPWIIWRLDVALARRSHIAAAQTGALWGLSALAGYPAMTILNFGFGGLWTLGRLFFRREAADNGDAVGGDAVGSDAEGSDTLSSDTAAARTPFFRRLGWGVVVWMWISVIGVTIMSPTYVSFFIEGRGYSDRVEPLTRERAISSNALHPGALLTFVSPYLSAVKATNRDLWKYSDPSMVSIYLGAVAFLLAFAALLSAPRARWRWWLAAMAAFFLLSTLGQALPLRGWLYDYVPPLRFFRHSAIFRAQYLFALAVLALYASRDLARPLSITRPQANRRGWLVLAGLAIPIALFTHSSLANLAESVQRPGDLPEAGRVAVWMWLTPALVGALMWLPKPAALRSLASKRPLLTSLAPWLLAFAALFDSWTAVEYSAQIMTSGNRISRETWERVDAEQIQDLDLTSRGFERAVQSDHGPGLNNRNQASKDPVLRSFDPFNNYYMIGWNRNDLLTSFATGADRIWFARRGGELPTSRLAFRGFSKRVASLGQPVLLLHPETASADSVEPEDAARVSNLTNRVLNSLPPMEKVATRVIAYHPNELHFMAEAPSDGWLWVTERFAAGWSATVDGQPTEIHRANFLFRGIKIPEGEHEIRFTYRPAFFPGLLLLSWGLLLLVAVAAPLQRLGVGRRMLHLAIWGRGLLDRLWRRPQVQNATLLLATCLTLLALVEGAFRLLSYDFEHKRSAHLRQPVFYRQATKPLAPCHYQRQGPITWQGAVLRTKLQLLGLPTTPYNDESEIEVHYDDDGFRNPRDLEDWQAVFVGDSFTELGNLPYEQLPTTLIGQQLGLQVKNLGVSATGPRSHLAYMRHFGVSASTRRAALVFFEGNDLADLQREDRFCRDVEQQNLDIMALGDRLDRQKPQSSFIKAVSATWQRWGRRPSPEDFHQAMPKAGSGIAAQPLTLAYRPPAAARLSEEEQHSLETIIAEWTELCRELGVEPWLVYAPSKIRVLQDSVEFLPKGQAFGHWPGQDLLAYMEQLAASNGVGFVSPVAEMQVMVARGKLTHNPFWDTHLNDNGARAMAAAVVRAWSTEAPIELAEKNLRNLPPDDASMSKKDQKENSETAHSNE